MEPPVFVPLRPPRVPAVARCQEWNYFRLVGEQIRLVGVVPFVAGGLSVWRAPGSDLDERHAAAPAGAHRGDVGRAGVPDERRSPEAVIPLEAHPVDSDVHAHLREAAPEPGSGRETVRVETIDRLRIVDIAACDRAGQHNNDGTDGPPSGHFAHLVESYSSPPSPINGAPPGPGERSLTAAQTRAGSRPCCSAVDGLHPAPNGEALRSIRDVQAALAVAGATTSQTFGSA